MGGAGSQISYCLPICGLEHHRASADDRVQPDPQSSWQGHQPWYVLETLGWYRHHAFCGYCGEIQAFPPWPAFMGGLAGWGFILFEIFSGETGGTAADCSEAVMTSFNYMRLIVTVGWSIYPLGYLFGYLLGAVDEVYLNVTYNVADFVNKIAFVLACWSCAKSDSEHKEALLG